MGAYKIKALALIMEKAETTWKLRYPDGTRIVANLAQKTGIEGIVKALEAVDHNIAATIMEGTEDYKRIVENPQVLLTSHSLIQQEPS